jgi:hypothetical protein
MDRTAIVYPAIAMFFLTAAMIARLAYLRIGAVQRGEISIRYFRLYTEGVQPDALQQIGRHVQNHFEVPPLFYAVVVLLYVTDSAGPLAVALAWLYFLSRCVHSFVHLGANDVRLRLSVWATSLLILTGLWLVLLVSLLSR